ncbi:N-(5'-phosphoribosyl)anthranilate isomerase [Tabrizicola sp. J26]|uniref:N-(5'-phosphoribosyl)anthranilate isomerase n=1 Tax=Alitabrizicola rongguiensis TaxID=2909234 RepID=UPI001F36ABAA|nr:N-(5'-phosphoribosyl)anthranilate isomerase [Tabrizicola rongguiensis]MCF1710113.1 N-(5'-phosphoribosyl)anthranilate isomerase [Tabrizicola rongguiensis]
MGPIRIADPEGWIEEVFSAKAVSKGGVIRRDLAWIDREIGRNRFVAEVRSRGFHLVETGGQWIVICSSGFFRVIC